MQPINHVFLIDDDPVVNMINKKIINLSNFTAKVTIHTEAKKALAEMNEIIDTDPLGFPDIIFLDINMPEMDGWEFLEEFARFPDSIQNRCKIYMLTSSIDTNDIERSKTYTSVADFISKPLSVAWLEIITSRVNKIF
jgi:CheY-like chemotaxis protein